MHLSTLYLLLGISFATQPKGIFGEYYGKFIGDVNTRAHNFSAKVYAVNDRKVRFKDFVYDGTGPTAYFWIGNGTQGPSNKTGKATTNEHGRLERLKIDYNKANIVITLPSKITDYGYIGIYCIQFDRNFGEVVVPPGFDLPAEQKLGQLVGIKHDVKASEVTLKDSATIELKEFHFDGKDSDVRFAVGTVKNAPANQLEKLMDEEGRDAPLVAYSGKTVTVRLLPGHHWNEYEWFTVYSFQSSESFGSMEISKTKSESLPVHDPSPDDPKSEGNRVFPTLIALSLGVGVAVCTATSISLPLLASLFR